jgi:hypothetical protein
MGGGTPYILSFLITSSIPDLSDFGVLALFSFVEENQN